MAKTHEKGVETPQNVEEIVYFDPNLSTDPQGDEGNKDGAVSNGQTDDAEKKVSDIRMGDEVDQFELLLKKEQQVTTTSGDEPESPVTETVVTVTTEDEKGPASEVKEAVTNAEVPVSDIVATEPVFKASSADQASVTHVLVASFMAAMESIDQTSSLDKNEELNASVKTVLKNIQTWFSGLGQALHSWETNSHKTFEGAKMLDHLPVQTESLLTKNQFSEIRGSTYSLAIKPIVSMILATVVSKLNESLSSIVTPITEEGTVLHSDADNTAKRSWLSNGVRTVPFDQLYGEPRLVLARMNNLLSSNGAAAMVYSTSQLSELAKVVSAGTKAINVIKVTPLRVEYELVTLA